MESAAAHKAQAEENAREVARVQALVRQEKLQEARLVAIRQRQVIQQAAAEAIAKAEARKVAKAQLTADKKREEVILATADTEEEEILPVAAAKPAAHATTAKSAGATHTTSHTPYTVRKGDNLTKLAQAHGVSVEELVAWNKLKSEAVMLGQRLTLEAPVEKDAPVATRPTAKVEKSRLAAITAAAVPQQVKPQVHLVQPGDTLFNISRRFNVSVQVLREFNHLTSDDVKLGQKLLVPQS